MNGTKTIIEYLTSVPAWYLATCDGDQPHVRPFSFAAEQDGHIWFCTATTKDVYRELQANPKFDDETLTFFTVDEPEAWICDIDGSWNPVDMQRACHRA